MCRNGFSLLECQVYLFLMTLSVLMMGTFMLNFLPSLRTLPTTLHNKIQLIVAYHVLVHDVAQAPFLLSCWKKKTATDVVWTIQGNDYGWSLHKKKLLRTKGIFNTVNQQWQEKVMSIALDQVKEISFEFVTTHQQVKVIHSKLVYHNETLSLSIQLRGLELCS